MAGHLDISNFVSDTVVYEIRYENGYLIWDRAGRLWTELRAKYPEMVLSDAGPLLQTFTWKRIHTLSVGLDKASVSTSRPGPVMKEFTELAESLHEVIVKNLQIELLTRIGLRHIYGYACESLEQANQHLLSTGLVAPPKPPNFGVEANPRLEAVFRWEGDSLGATVRMRAEHRTAEVEIPATFESPKIPKIEKHLLIFDVDYYTKKVVNVGQLRASEWINNALHIIRKDSSKFLAAQEKK